MKPSPSELSDVLTSVFKSLTVSISRNHNSQSGDTWVISISELNKDFIFDSNTGKFLGAIDTPTPAVPPVPAQTPRGKAVVIVGHGGPGLGASVGMSPLESFLGNIVSRGLPGLPLPEPIDESNEVADLLVRKFGR